MKEEFKCLRCGNCCRWPGYVRVNNREIDAIAAFLGISPDLPLIEEAGSVISLFEIKVSLRSDGKYKFDFKGPRVTLTEKNPGCEEYVIYLNGEPHGKISSSK